MDQSDLAPAVLRRRPLVEGIVSLADFDVVNIDEVVIGRVLILLPAKSIYVNGYWYAALTYQEEIQIQAGINEQLLNANIAACIQNFLRQHGYYWLREI